MQLFIPALVSKCSLYQCSNVVAVTVGRVYTLEMATRAKTQLIMILAESERKDYKKYFANYQKHFQTAADKGLIELSISANVN